MSLKEQIFQNKIQKKRKLIRKFINQTGSVDTAFAYFKYRPSEQNFEDMVIASNFGPGDPLSAGGNNFAIEYLFDELNQQLRSIREGKHKFESLHQDGEGIGIYTSQSEVWANLFFCFQIDETLYEFITELRSEDFIEVEGEDFYVDKETNSIAIKVTYNPQLPLSKLFYEGEKPNQRTWTNHFLKSNNLATRYDIRITTVDKLIAENEREKHGVKRHERHLKSGKIVLIRAHERSIATTLISQTHFKTKGMASCLSSCETFKS